MYKKNVLLIIDCQNDFLEYGALAINNSSNIFLKISEFIKKYENHFDLIFTQDWHPVDHCSFENWPKHCIKFTYGAKLVDLFKNIKNKKIIKKGTKRKIENYSAFFNGNKKTNLLKLIKKSNYKNIFIVGVAGEYCVKETALDSIKFNLNTRLISDLILFIDESKKDYMINYFIYSNDIEKYLV